MNLSEQPWPPVKYKPVEAIQTTLWRRNVIDAPSIKVSGTLSG
jgi:hypothetical protein